MQILRQALIFTFLASSAGSLVAQIGDKAGEAQLPIVPAAIIPPSPALSANEELKTFKVAPGYRIELVAEDPLVRNPVALTFAADGKLWIVEMTGYMPDLDGSTEDRPEGRIVVLSDTDGDGKMDKRCVFLENIVLPRAIALHRDGALVGAPPNLWFCRDTDGDGMADEKTDVATDFGVRVDPTRPQLANPERAPNALLWGHDGWLYAGAYPARFRYDNGKWLRESSAFRGQWGLGQDDFGRLYSNNNSDFLRVDVIPFHYLQRNPHLVKPSGLNTKAATDQSVWPIRVNPGINRGYRPEMLRDYKLKDCTAACSPWIYRSDLFPTDAYNNAFICEPAGNLVKRFALQSEDGLVRASPFYNQQEFLASTDERFRPVNLTTGPEGALYIVDLYHGVIQHRISLTSYLREQIISRGLDKPLSLGRIWRIIPEKTTPPKKEPLLSSLDTEKLANELASGNSWRRETAQRLLSESGKPETVSSVARFGKQTQSPMGRAHALWTLNTLGAVDWTLAKMCLADSDSRVRSAAIRVSETLLQGTHRSEVLASWREMAQTETSVEVKLQLVLSLGEARDTDMDLVAVKLANSVPSNALLRDAFLSGIKDRELRALEAALGSLASHQKGLPEALLGCVLATRDPSKVHAALELVAKQPLKSTQISLMRSLASHPTVNAKHPVRMDRQPDALKLFATNSDSSVVSAAAIVGAILTWPGKSDVVKSAIKPLSNEEQALFDLGRQTYTGLCAACHQPSGKGQEGLAPPLVDSEWVNGSHDRVARIVIHGLRGPLTVKGVQYSLDMPAAGFLTDQQIAGVLTYIRREWDHEAAPVQTQDITKIRRETQTRTDAWTEPELLQIP